MANRSLSPGDIRVLGGGHCYEDFVYNANTKAVIDITGINSINFSGTKLIVGAGNTNWDSIKALFKRYGKQLPGGSCYSVGLGGHITGGGYGLSSRAFGLTVDWVSGFEVVINDGTDFKTITATKDQNADLFTALRGGGGGSFGIITNYLFDALPDAYEGADLFAIAINWSSITDWTVLKSILNVYTNYCKNVGTSPTPADQQWSPNIFALGKFMHKANGQIMFGIQSAWKTTAEQEAQYQQVKNFVTSLETISGVVLDFVRTSPIGHPSLMQGFALAPDDAVFDIDSTFASQSMSWIDATMTNNGSGPNQRGNYNSAYFRTMLTDIQIQEMFDYLSGSKDTPDLDYSQTLLQIDSYGGQINQYSGGNTSIKQRSSIMKGQFQIYWNDGFQNQSDLDTQYVAWLTAFFTDMFKETGGFPDPTSSSSAAASVDGCYVNYPNSILGTNGGTPDIHHALNLYFGQDIAASLIKTKAQYDPDNWFQHAQSIPMS
ncbi:MAG: FAD-binding protein [Paracoccaceae bacterium]|nr:FAD-binding protein [Paracoccaceae bacterium]MDE2674870.1 FAD-binding protein [Paracoccaceae bacterium]